MMLAVAVDAVVREWHGDEGWGVVDAPDTPGGCWAHFSHVATPSGLRELAPGQAVLLEYEAADQDGYSYRALRVWLRGAQLADNVSEPGSAAYRSTATIRYDPPS